MTPSDQSKLAAASVLALNKAMTARVRKDFSHCIDGMEDLEPGQLAYFLQTTKNNLQSELGVDVSLYHLIGILEGMGNG